MYISENKCHDSGFNNMFIISGSHKSTPTSEPVNTAYVFSRKDLSRQGLTVLYSNKVNM